MLYWGQTQCKQQQTFLTDSSEDIRYIASQQQPPRAGPACITAVRTAEAGKLKIFTEIPLYKSSNK